MNRVASLIQSPAARGVALISAVLLCLAGFWWSCRTNPTIPFLVDSGEAAWIVYPKPPDANPHRAVALPAEFRHVFSVAGVGSHATLTARAFNQGIVVLNGHPVLSLAAADWKKPSTADVTALLHEGTNTLVVTVSNRFGPPALALHLELDGKPVVATGRSNGWEVSWAGAVWTKAVHAAAVPAIRPGNDLYGRPTIVASLGRAWPNLLLLTFVSGLLLVGFERLTTLRLPPGPNLLRGLANPVTAALVFALLAWVLLFANNVPQIAPLFGFDRDGHTEYINYILEKSALPLANEGWQMYQPPLYYLVSAFLLFPFDLSASSDSALLVLRAFSGLIGLTQIVLLFLCFRLLFPEQPSKQALGVLLGAFLPAHLYVSHHVTNETLAACLVTATFYFTLRVMRDPTPRPWLAVAAGACLGLALLAKFSAVLVAPFVIAALCWRSRPVFGEAHPRFQVRLPLLAFTALLVTCGWHYARVWYHFSNPLIGNWDPSLPFAWWQEPGYRTAAWYTHFGQALLAPMFSSLHSFADGLYSSLWGDALGSGSSRMLFRPPWNHDLAHAGYVLALFPTLLLLVGTVRACVQVVRRPTPETVVFGTIIAAFAFGLIFMTLRVPSYAQVKAFYALPALLPVCFLAVFGWEWLTQKAGRLRPVLWLLVVTWAATVFATFWIRSWDPYTQIAHGISDADHGFHEQAAARFARALRSDPNSAAARVGLASSLQRLGHSDKAKEWIDPMLPIAAANTNGVPAPELYELLFQSAALSVVQSRHQDALEPLNRIACCAPDHPSAWRQLATCLGLLGRDTEAVAARKQALRINPYDAQQHQLQAQALSRLKEPSAAREAVSEYDFALRLNPDNVEVLNNSAWLLATSSADNVRDGHKAVEYAKRACDLTSNREPVLLGTLAAAYAEARQFPEAIAAATDAINTATALGNSEVAARNAELLKLYQAGKPAREHE